MQVTIEHKVFEFKSPSGTSRGVLTEKHAWFIKITDNGKTGIGECSIIPGLSPDFENEESYEKALFKLQVELEKISLKNYTSTAIDLLHEVNKNTNLFSDFEAFPSLLFGMETALLNWSNGNKNQFFDTAFSRGEQKIPINGLVWMGNAEFMTQQINDKLKQGFNCIKMKVGAIDFDNEIALLTQIRNEFSEQDIILRVDANGAFTADNVRERLKILAKLNIHSIEQPIATKQYELMAKLCAENILPIALDEELIGVHARTNKEALLDKINPPFIILKPSLHGGILGAKEWIELAEARKIDWWMTSALESNIGLTCIAQFTSTYTINKHHGLGTGSLYVKNIPSKLVVADGFLLQN